MDACDFALLSFVVLSAATVPAFSSFWGWKVESGNIKKVKLGKVTWRAASCEIMAWHGTPLTLYLHGVDTYHFIGELLYDLKNAIRLIVDSLSPSRLLASR